MNERNSIIKKPTIGVLTPVFNEESSLSAYIKKVKSVLLSNDDYLIEILLVDDGSTDESWKIISEICEQHQNVSGIRLSRNYGSHIALTAGFDHIEADAVATLACDLQDPPEIILEFAKIWKSGKKIVWGHRKTRKDASWRIATSQLFYVLLKKFAMPENSKFATGSFFLIDKDVVNCYRQFRESSRITFAIVAWTGFDQGVVEYDRKIRLRGKSKWNFLKMTKSMFDAFVGFSLFPIRIMMTASLLALASSLALGIYVFFSWYIGSPIPGWSSTILAFSMFFSIQFFLLSVMGEYLYRIYMEVVERPLYFTSEKTNHLNPKHELRKNKCGPRVV